MLNKGGRQRRSLVLEVQCAGDVIFLPEAYDLAAGSPIMSQP